ncbi:MAG: 5-formyltetrahydrofolate cyclo-ligase [Bacillota bacterium]
MTKREQRKKLLAIRKKLSAREVRAKSKSITTQLFNTEEFDQARTILSYIDFNNEVKTKPIIKRMLADSKRVVVPITDRAENRLYLSELRDFDKELEVGSYGILEPKEEYQRLIQPCKLDLILMPGLGFDHQRNRIGYGGGYYDRLLAEIPEVETIALAFEEQLVANIKTSSHDCKVKQIITETRIIRGE